MMEKLSPTSSWTDDIEQKLCYNGKTAYGNAEMSLTSSLHYKLLKESEVIQEFDAPDENFKIYGICPTVHRTAWICCKNSKTVTLVDDTGVVLQEVQCDVLINGVQVAPSTGNLWTSGSKGSIMEMASIEKLNLQFNINLTPLSLCVTKNNHIIVGMPRRINCYDYEGHILLSTTSTDSSNHDNRDITSERSNKIPNKVMEIHASGIRSGPEVNDLVLNKSKLQDGEENINLLATYREPKKNNIIQSDHSEEPNGKTCRDTGKKHGRSVVSTPHIIAECPATNNFAVVDLDLIRHGGHGNQPFILVLNKKLEPLLKCKFRHKCLINDLDYDKVGNIVVADYCGVIFLLCGSGKFIKRIFSPSNAVHPFTIRMDRSRDEVWAVFRDSKGHSIIKIIKYSTNQLDYDSDTKYSQSNIYVITKF